MPSVYCQCGYKNNYSSTKPKTCQSCGEPFEKKPSPKHHQTRRAHCGERGDEIEPEIVPEFNETAIRDSIILKRDGTEGKFMTVEQLRKSEGSFSRGSAPIDNEVRDQIMGEMLGTRQSIKEPSGPTENSDIGARRVSRLTK